MIPPARLRAATVAAALASLLAAPAAARAEDCPAAAELRAKVAKLARSPDRVASLLRRAVAGQGCEVADAMMELIRIREKALARAYPQVKPAELVPEGDVPEGLRLPYGVALARRGKADQIVPALILESRYLSSAAEMVLWRTYLHGYERAVPPLDPRIRAFVLELADEGVPRMQLWAWRIHDQGLGVRRDPERAERFLAAAAAHLDEARLDLGRLRIEQGRYEEARDVLESLAEANPDEPTVLNALADLYLGSKPPVQSCEKGRAVLQRLGDELHDADALLLLAVAHRSADPSFACFPKSEDRSLEYLRAAAERGSAEAKGLLEQLQ